MNFGMYNMQPQIAIDRISKQIEELEGLKTQYMSMQSPQQPVNNIINAGQQQTIQNNQLLYEMKVLNENDEAENIFVNNNTIFIGNDKMQIKKLDGSIEKYKINKIYPVDKKDIKIQELENEIIKLKEAMSNGYTKPIESVDTGEQSNTNANGIDKSSTTKSSKSITK